MCRLGLKTRMLPSMPQLKSHTSQSSVKHQTSYNIGKPGRPQPRTVCLLLVTIAAGSVFFLEQPSSSLLRYHMRFKWMVRELERRGIRVP